VLRELLTTPDAPAPGPPPATETRPANSEETAASAGLGVYAGTYRSDEIESDFTIAVNDGALTLQRESDTVPLRLQVQRAGSFRVAGFEISFERMADRVTGLVVDAGRVRGIRFTRVE